MENITLLVLVIGAILLYLYFRRSARDPCAREQYVRSPDVLNAQMDNPPGVPLGRAQGEVADNNDVGRPQIRTSDVVRKELQGPRAVAVEKSLDLPASVKDYLYPRDQLFVGYGADLSQRV